MARKKKEPGNGTKLLPERLDLQADGTGKLEPSAEEITVAAGAAANAHTTAPAEPPAPQKKRDPVAELLKQATGAVQFGRSQLTPPKHGNARSRAERFEIADELEEAMDKVQAWLDIVPELVRDRSTIAPKKFGNAMDAFKRAYNRLQDELDELKVRRCKATSHSVAQAIEILESPKWRGPTVDLADAKEVLRDLERVVRTGKPLPGVNARGDTTAWTLWKAIKGRCYTCGSQLPRDFHVHHCNLCHKAFLAERQQAERQQAEQQATDDAKLLAQLREHTKKN